MAKPARIPTGNPAGPPERKVLAPLRNFPIEVTRDEADGQQPPTPAPAPPTPIPPSTAAEVPTAITEALPEAIQNILDADLPAATAPQTTVITACEQRLQAAQTLRERMEARTLTAYYHYAGPAVRLAHATGSWKEVTDPRTGRPCRSWSAWLRLANVSRQHAYRMVKEEPITQALAGLNTGTLGVRRIDVLSPVLNQEGGADKVRQVWTTAADTGDTSAPALERVRDQLGLRPTTDDPDEDDGDGGSPKSATALRFQTAPGTFDESLVRQVAREQPDVSRMVARTILAELGED